MCSLWLHTVCGAFTHNHAGAGESPEMRTIFYRLVTVSQMLLHAHFVFDGPKRPKLKRGKHVKIAPHFLTQRFQELISAFGFTWHEVGPRIFVTNATSTDQCLGPGRGRGRACKAQRIWHH